MLPSQLFRDRPPLTTALLHVAFLALALLLGTAAANVTAGDDPVSLWWPAAGLNVLAVLALPRERLLLGALDVAVVMAIANGLGDHSAGLSLAFGVANAVEAAVVVLILTHRRRHASLVVPRDLFRLALAVGVGALAGALVTAVALAPSGEPPLAVILGVMTSHASASFAIVPVAIAGNHRPTGATPWARPLQCALLVAVILVVFWPDHSYPLTFLPMPFLVWATYLYSTRWVSAQLLTLAFVVTMMTAFGGGPFGDGVETPNGWPISLVQVFLLTYVLSILAFATTQEERRQLRERLAERDQMLHGGIVDAQFGMVIMNEVGPDVIQVVQSNRRAARLLGLPFVERDAADDDEGADLPLLPVDRDQEPSALLRAIDTVRASPRGEIYDEFDVVGGRHVELHLTRVPRGNGEAILTAQVIDVTMQRRADSAILRALQDERAAAEHLRDLNRQKDDFVSTVSHELRSPITSIIGFVELVLDDTETSEEQRRHLAVVERNANRLRDLVEDLLEVGAGAGSHVVPTATELRSLCADVVEELTPYAADHEIELTLMPGDDVPCVVKAADISREVTNLVTNAVKFTPAGGLIAVQVSRRDDEALLTVTDTGVGIKAEDLERVFDRFYRSSSASETKVPGAGLGLALVRNLVTRNGGTVELDSNGTSGTQAIVRLPLPVSAPDAVAPDAFPDLGPLSAPPSGA